MSNTMQEIRLQARQTARQKLVGLLWRDDTPGADVVSLAKAADMSDAEFDFLSREIAAAKAAKPLADDLPRLRREHTKAAAAAAKVGAEQAAIIAAAEAAIDAARAVARQTAARVAEAEEAYDYRLAPLAYRGDVPPSMLPKEFLRRQAAEAAEQKRLTAHKAFCNTKKAVAAIRGEIETIRRKIDARDTREADGISTTQDDLRKRLVRLNKDLAEANADLAQAAAAARAVGAEIIE